MEFFIAFLSCIGLLFSLVYSVSILIIFIGAFYDSCKKRKAQHIFNEVNALYKYDFEYTSWNYILDEIYLHKGLLRKYYKKAWFRYYRVIKPYFSEELSNIVYTRAVNSNSSFFHTYIYSFMQAAHSFTNYNSHFFNYDFFQYCEEKILNELDSEQGYMHLCLNQTLLENIQFTDENNQKFYKYNKCLACLCRELISIEFPKYEFNWNRIVSYVEKACNNIKNKYTDIEHELIEELCNAYINTLTNKDNRILKSRGKNQYIR